MSKFEEYDLYAENKDFLVSDSVITFNDTDGTNNGTWPGVAMTDTGKTNANGQTIYSAEVSTSMEAIIFSGLKDDGSGYRDQSPNITDYQTVMQLMLRNKDRFPWEKLFSHHFSIEDYETAIKTSMTDESMKVVIDPWM